jgi:hypothetical protein
MLPRTKMTPGFHLRYTGGDFREADERFPSMDAAKQRAAALRLKRFDIWHSDGWMASNVYADHAY